MDRWIQSVNEVSIAYENPYLYLCRDIQLIENGIGLDPTDHVVVRINQRIGSLGDSDIVDRVFVFAEILHSKISRIL